MTRFFLLLALLPLLLLAGPARAQLHLPTLPQLTQPLQDRLRPATDPLRERTRTLLEPLDLRRLGDALLERHPRRLARDPEGQLIVRAQLLAQPSSAEARERLLAQPGVRLIEETRLEGLELGWLLLRADTALLPRLRALDPEGRYDYQHLYLGSGATGATGSGDGAVNRGDSADGSGLRIGLIDSGVARRHPALRGAAIERFGCPEGDHPAPHGTAVASLLVGRDARFQGALPGATLLAADAYCDAPDGGSVQRVAQSLAWLTREKAGVVNISLVGPANLLLQAVVAAAQKRGLLIVAAVGNDGPAAPPLYPAAWPGVVAVTAVDARRRALPEAGRGAHLLFAAPGGGLWGAAVEGNAYVELRGTSFAAPLVAALLARDPSLDQLRAQAVDLGAAGRDEIYGWGLVGEPLRTRRP